MIHNNIIIISIIIIIKRGRQGKVERESEWYTRYQYKDHSLTIQTYRQEEEKGKNCGRL